MGYFLRIQNYKYLNLSKYLYCKGVLLFRQLKTERLPNDLSGGVAASILFEIDDVRIFHAKDSSLLDRQQI